MNNEEHVLRLGESFERRPRAGFHAIRYDFKPASIDTACEGTLDVGKGDQVTITLPNVEGSTPPTTVFKGSKRPCMKECVLIINHDTGEYTLEKLTSNIQVKKTRFEGSSKIQSRLEQQQPQQSGRAGQQSGPTKSASRATSGSKTSPEKEKLSPEPLHDIEKELLAEARAIEMSNASSSDSDSSSSGSESSNEELESRVPLSPAPTQPLAQPQPTPLQPQIPAPPIAANLPNGTTRAQPPSEHRGYMSTLRSDLQLSESGSDSDD
uniref:ELL-associated factor 1 n=1 Tax=Petromyzon marinus TaxID=7757 RepID=A0AAJ7TTH5_PETMA|nr:ELL-associated factor 1 [Petromyzon marinus]